ncbi:MAG: ComF family protein [Dehalococcoidia bacterium]|nr:ComF family protein [Dehalococcoidia bacterium]
MGVTRVELERVFRRGISLTLDALYPSRCVGCHRHGTPLCDTCIASAVPASGEGRCANCAAEWLEPDGYCPRCLGWTHLNGARAAFEHAGVARRSVHALKYGRQTIIAPVMAAAMRDRLDLTGFDAGLAIPLHPSRRKRRGFNQGDRLLPHLSLAPLPGQLLRRRKTRSQVGMSLEQRRRNVAGAFAYDGAELDGLRVALIDDVITTGATADECAAVLKDYGAAEVIAVAFTRMSYRPGTPGIED